MNPGQPPKFSNLQRERRYNARARASRRYSHATDRQTRLRSKKKTVKQMERESVEYKLSLGTLQLFMVCQQGSII